jgi:hypothetical protein
MKLLPLERTLPPRVYITGTKNQNKDHNPHEPSYPKGLENNGPGVKEDHFNIKQNEKHRYEIEANEETVGGQLKWLKAALKRRTLLLTRFLRAKETGQEEDCSD